MRRAALAAAALAGAAAVLVALLRVGEQPGALSGRQALVLGVVQGLTELLPISSSGHLILVPWLGDWTYLREHDAFNQTFDVALHAGTLVAVVAYFRHDVAALARAFVRVLRTRAVRTAEERIAVLVAVATIPAALIGAVGESVIAELLGEPWQIAILLAVFAVVLYWADRRAPTRAMDELRTRDALAVGLAQAVALAPGVSRSGITITAGRLLGLDRDAAARFSFLLLIPIVAGAAVLKGVQHVVLEGLPPGSAGPFAVGMVASALSGLAAIQVLLAYVRRHDYSVFVGYRIAAAAAVLAVIAVEWRPATF